MLISIITVVKNGVQYIEECVQSVLKQSYKPIEYIVIDGGSTDGTLEVLKKYQTHFAHFISEPDESMYHALNKGMKLAKGAYIQCLNADDYLYSSSTIENVVSSLQTNPDFLYGNIIRNDEGKLRYTKLRKYNFIELLCAEHGTFVPHPCLFVANAFLKQHQLNYDTNFKYAADFYFILYLLKNAQHYVYYPNFITVFREHDQSITASGKLDEERLSILNLWGLKELSFMQRKYYYYKNWIEYKLRNAF